MRLREQGIIVRHFNKPRIGNFLRITIGTQQQNDELLQALGIESSLADVRKRYGASLLGMSLVDLVEALESYDVASDPLQRTNLRQTDPERFRAMRTRMIKLRTTVAAVPAEEMSPERLWELRMAPSDGYW